MKEWEDLVSTALLGTAKRDVPDAMTMASRPLADAGVRHAEPAGRLLDQAAVLTTYRRAGRLPRTGLVVGEPAPPETKPRVSRAAARRLQLLLDDRPGLLPEWLALCAEAGARVPEELLPDLFDRARVSRAIARRLAPVAGERGHWLAAQNPEWHQVLDHAATTVETLEPEVWETGRRADRVAYLAALRGSEPAAARELLAASWATEDPGDRVEFAAVLTDGLSADDETFLENALDDRRKEVRELAQVLLGRIPGSGYATRMRQRLRRCIEIKPDGVLRQRPRLEVRPPLEVDRAMRRDGIPAKPPARLGEDPPSTWLRELVARSPLSTWTELTGLPPEQTIELHIGPHEDAVRSGWWAAAVRQENQAWAAALVTTWRPGSTRQPGPLLEVLEPDRRRTITARMLADYPADEAAITWIAGCSGPWDNRLGRTVLRSISELRRHRPYALSGVRAVLAERLPIALVGDLEVLAEQRTDAMTATLDKVADDIRFRHEMAQEIASTARPPKTPPMEFT